MVTFNFILRDERVAHFDALLAALRDQDYFTGDREAQLRDQLSAAGPGAHRVSLHSTRQVFTVELRPLGSAPAEVVLDAAGIIDQRQHPTRLGPDLGWQVRRLAEVRSHGADESVLLDDSGAVISAIGSPILAFEGADVHVSAHPRATESVMLDEIVAHLQEVGLQVVEQPQGFTLLQLRQSEVWVLNILGGVQRVRGWLEYGSIMDARTLTARTAPTHTEVEAWRWENATEI